MREYTALPFEYLEEMDVLSDAEYGRLIRALQKYSMSGQEPELNGTEKVYWKRVRNRENRYREGFEDQDRAKSERALKAANARWSNAKDANACASITSNARNAKTKANTETKTKANTETKRDKAHDAPTRHRYGEYENVLLTDDELEKLKNEFPADWQDRIERLSGYIASSGKKYKSHLATIRNWARGDEEKTAKKSSGLPDGKFHPGEAECAAASRLARYREQLREG